ncbi:MAG: hypothetical protein OXH79_03550 [Boseongicola sp.]|nr:hypothetical protein [Boseongicola sp.]
MYLLAAVLATLILVPSVALSQIATCTHQECKGSIRNEHNHGGYRFFTTSHVYQDGDDFIYETCVENVGENDVEINWAIPGPNSVVPRGCAISARRPFPKRQTMDNYSGCLRYGAYWEWKRAPFHPHRSDELGISYEDQIGCREIYAAQSFRKMASSVREVSFSAQRFGASVHGDSTKTLSKMDFVVTVTPKPDLGTFFTSIETSFSPAYENHPNYYTKGFTIRPSKSAYDQDLFAGAKGIYDGGTVLWKGAVKYEMKIPKDPVQKYVRYDVLSANDDAVASIDVPVWVSGN